MKIKFLGTGASEGIPALFCGCKLCKEARLSGKFHTRSQLLIGENVLIDFPPDTYYRAIRYGVRLDKISSVFVTHSHSDHFYSEDFFMRGLASSFLLEKEKVTVYGSNGVSEIFKKNDCALEYGSYTDTPIGEVNGYKTYGRSSEYKEITPFEKIEEEGYIITPLLAKHMPKETCFIYLMERDGKSVLYATDTAVFPKETFEYLKNNVKNINAVILDGTYGNLDMHEGHMNFQDDVFVKEQLIKDGVANGNTEFFITHIFHGAAKDTETLEKSVPQGFTLAYDGYEVQL